MMWHASLLLQRDFIRDDWETIIHLHRIGIDDLAVELQREFHG